MLFSHLLIFTKISFSYLLILLGIIPNSFEPGLARHSVGPDLGPIFKLRLSADHSITDSYDKDFKIIMAQK